MFTNQELFIFKLNIFQTFSERKPIISQEEINLTEVN